MNHSFLPGGFFLQRPRAEARAGFLLLSVLLLMGVLIMLLTTLLSQSRFLSHLSIYSYKDSLRLKTAESGLAFAISKLREEPSWSEDTVASMENGQGQFSIAFSSVNSVNNLQGVGELHDVPAQLARVVVEGRFEGGHTTLEALVGRVPLVIANDAVMARGRISLQGDVRVSGLKAFDDNEATDGDIVSASQANAADQVVWRRGSPAGGSLVVDGAVRSSSPHVAAIDVSGGNVRRSSHINQAVPEVKAPDIFSEIRQHQGATRPTLNPGETVLNSGDYYLSSLEHSGDIVLNGANLYVDGSFNLNGSIRGSGAIYVGGDTKLYGSASVTANDENHIALMSQGKVELQGFDGSRYLRDLAVPRVLTATAWRIKPISTISALD